ncbi:MAG: copper chaperone PCu(A)C [Gemmatimonadales bacterium]
MYLRRMSFGIVFVLAGCGGRHHEPAAKVGDIDIIEPFVMEPIRPDVTAGYLTIQNHGDSADALVDATTPVAEAATLHGTPGGGGGMRHLSQFEVPARGKASLAPGGTHLMLTDVHRKLAPGDTVPITLRFQHAGSVTVPFVVRTYESVGR